MHLQKQTLPRQSCRTVLQRAPPPLRAILVRQRDEAKAGEGGEPSGMLMKVGTTASRAQERLL